MKILQVLDDVGSEEGLDKPSVEASRGQPPAQRPTSAPPQSLVSFVQPKAFRPASRTARPPPSESAGGSQSVLASLNEMLQRKKKPSRKESPSEIYTAEEKKVSNVEGFLAGEDFVLCHLPESVLREPQAGGISVQIPLVSEATPVAVLDQLFSRDRGLGREAMRVEKRVTLCLRTRSGGTPIWLCETEQLKDTVEEWRAVSDKGWPRLFVQV